MKRRSVKRKTFRAHKVGTHKFWTHKMAMKRKPFRIVEKWRSTTREFFEWAFVWGDVDPHGGGLGAREPDGCTVVVEVRATALFEGLGGGVEEACV